MSRWLSLTEAHPLLRDVRQQSALHALACFAFIAACLLAWVSLKPFPDQTLMELGELASGKEAPTYAAFGAMALLAVALAFSDNIPAFRSLATWYFITFLVWMVLTLVWSMDFNTSIRRFALFSCVCAVAVSMPLLPRSPAEMIRWFSIAALIVLALCFTGVFLAGKVSIHQPTDFLESHLAGSWRGAFGHKNIAAAMMPMLVFIGIAAVRSGMVIAGPAISVLAAVFLIGTGGKSALALCIVVLAVSAAVCAVRSLRLRAVLSLSPLLLLNLLTIGTVMNDGLDQLAALLPIDTTFTGRTDIWQFALESFAAHPLSGYGFGSFWGSRAILDLTTAGMEWAGTASHSHNGYLDTALTLGMPGLMLLLVVLVILPLKNFQLAGSRGNQGPLADLFLQIWLFGIYLSALESFFFDREDPVWFTFLVATFGLHYLARFRLTESRAVPQLSS